MESFLASSPPPWNAGLESVSPSVLVWNTFGRLKAVVFAATARRQQVDFDQEPGDAQGLERGRIVGWRGGHGDGGYSGFELSDLG
jgi:hypothetical protein